VAGGYNPDAVESFPAVENNVTYPVMDYVSGLAANVVAFSEVELDGRRSSVRTVESNEGNLVADALFWQASQLAADFSVPEPDVAIQNGGGIRNNNIIPAGDLSELNTFEILPFSNFVTILPAIPRGQFKEVLENAVSRVEFTDGRFAQVSGFRFEYDPAGTPQELADDGTVVVAGSRIVNVWLDDGTPIVENGGVVPGADLSVATIDFLAKSGDEYPYRGAAFTTLGVTYQQALSNFLQDGLGGLVTAADYPVGGNGRIATVGGGLAARVEDDLANHPNPFNPSTTIRFSMPVAGQATLRVFDTRGRLVKTLVDENLAAGRHAVVWDGKDDGGRSAASGVYFYRLRSDDRIATKSMLLVK
jgi:5'-nucleotidase